MAKKKVREQATIQATTPKDFDQLVNEAMAQAAGRGLSVVAIDRRVEDGFVAFIDLEGDVEVCESVMEEYEARGECYRCGHCPFLHRVSDKRIKYLACDKGMREPTQWGNRACPCFYEALDRGEVEVYEEED